MAHTIDDPFTTPGRNAYSAIPGPGEAATLADFKALVFNPFGSRYPDSRLGWAANDIRHCIANHEGEEVRGQLIRHCKKCSRRSFGVWLSTVQGNGVRVAQLRCVRCAYCNAVRSDKKVYPQASGPLFADNRDDTECERCDSDEGVELHHWAPQHLFYDAWQWPMSYLCRYCHQEWHQTIKNHR